MQVKFTKISKTAPRFHEIKGSMTIKKRNKGDGMVVKL